jgi:pyrroloquinoline quinone biosynthesis protein B
VQIRVLGAAAGGGLPQWNCGCPNCRKARSGSRDVAPRTQECVAVSFDGARWLLLNASPEIRSQIESFPKLHPREPRHSPIAGIVLTNGDLDHCLGLLSLRESHPLTIYATSAVQRGFTVGNMLYQTLERFPGQVTWRPVEGELCDGLSAKAIPTPGKPPIHLERCAAIDPEENIGVVLHERISGKRLAYFSAAAGITPAMREAMDAADCVFFDGTFWSSDELIRLGVGTKRANDMAHIPVAESLAALDGLDARKIYIHINNTNPMLDRTSAESRLVENAGWEIAEDGMEFSL